MIRDKEILRCKNNLDALMKEYDLKDGTIALNHLLSMITRCVEVLENIDKRIGELEKRICQLH